MQTGEEKNRKMFEHAAKIFFMNWKIFALEIIWVGTSDIENKYFRETQTTEFNRADGGAATAALVGVKKLLADSVVFCFMYVMTNGLL